MLLVMCVGYFLVLLDVTIVNVALPRIGAGLTASVGGLQWIVDGYSVALAALLLTGGTVGDVRGHKRVVLTGLVIFGAGSLCSGLAPGIGVLVAGRVVQGVGAALLLPGTLAIITDAFPGKEEQARAIGIWASIGSAALPAGPLLGGALIQVLTWRAVFMINVPIVIIAGLIAIRIVPAGERTPGRRVDWPGAATGGLFLAFTVFAVIDAGHRGLTIVTLIPAVAALLLLGGFLLLERRTAHPMLPLGLFTRPAFSTANLVAGVMNLGTLGLLFVLTLYLQGVRNYSPLSAGIALLPLFLPLMILSPLAGRLTARVGPKLPMALGLVVAAAGVALFPLVDPQSRYQVLLPVMLAWGIGMGILTPAVVAAALAAVGPGQSGLGSGVNNTSRQALGAVGIAVYGAVAGSPGSADRFVTAIHHLGLATAALFVLAAVATVTFIPTRSAPVSRSDPGTTRG